MIHRTSNRSYYVEKYGFGGLLLFVAIPLPGTGIWSATLAAVLLNIRFKFSDYVKESSVDKESNYSFEYNINGSDKILFPDKIEVVDENTVIITFDYFLQDGKLYVEIDNVYDIAGQYQYDDLREKVKFSEK